MAHHRFNEQTYYEILEIGPGAPQHEINAAYQRAKSTYSPESPALYSMFTPEEARELLRLIEEAYETLSNHALRKEYDKKLEGQTRRPAMDGGDLPDFDIAEIEDIKRSRKEHRAVREDSSPKKSGKLPDGFKRTRHSVYEVDGDFEQQIAACERFDGEMLQKIRIYKKINLDQMSLETRISKTYLSAVEGNNFEALPAAVFVRGFVVQMARILGLNQNLVADSYMKIFRQHHLD